MSMLIVNNRDTIISLANQIAVESSDMIRKIIGKDFPIKSLTIFSHAQAEFEELSLALSTMGVSYNYNNGPRVELSDPIKIDNNVITHVRIRKPDLERPQIGCNDFDTDYEMFKKKYLFQFPENLSLIVRPEYEMIELHDKRYDILAYIVSN